MGFHGSFISLMFWNLGCPSCSFAELARWHGVRGTMAWLGLMRNFFCIPRMLGPESASGMGRAHGLGHIKHSDGDSYTGEWYNGRAHGCGVYRFQDGAACYEGQFRCDHRDGLGVESWVDGSCPLAPKRWIGVEQSNMKHMIQMGMSWTIFPKRHDTDQGFSISQA